MVDAMLDSVGIMGGGQKQQQQRRRQKIKKKQGGLYQHCYVMLESGGGVRGRRVG